MLAATVSLLAGVHARAAIVADFNGDGIPDAVVVPRPPDTNIVVHLSGSTPQVLKFHGRVLSIVATDIDHDGEIDLSALSERRGVVIWLNKGRGGAGRLKALKPRHHHRRFSFARRRLASPQESSSEGTTTTSLQDDRDHSLHHQNDFYQPSRRRTLKVSRPRSPAASDDLAFAASPRAPPLPLQSLVTPN